MLEAFIWFNVMFFVRMIVIFTVMMKYYHWVDKEGALWETTKGLWEFIAKLFFVVDVIYNWYLSLLFWDLAISWGETVSWRMKRYLKSATGFKLIFAKIMRRLLNFSDPGHL